jgi:para-nitrobenzyl esterase
LYGWTAERLARKQTAVGAASYLYYFDHGYPAADAAGLHAFHGSELPFVFGTLGTTPVNWPKSPGTPQETGLSEAMIGYWTSFARTGKPAGWPAYGSARSYMAFTDGARAAERLLPGMFELHEEAVARRKAGDLAWNWNTGVVSPKLAAQ